MAPCHLRRRAHRNHHRISRRARRRRPRARRAPARAGAVTEGAVVTGSTDRIEFREDIQAITDLEGKELPSKRIHDRFIELYVEQPGARLKFLDHHTYPDPLNRSRRIIEATILDRGRQMVITGVGNGPIDGFVDALSKHVDLPFSVLDYSEHSIQRGSNASAICYVEIEYAKGRIFGAGINTNIVAASLEAVVSAVNRIIG